MKRLINLTPPPASKLFLGLLPFALLLLLYVVASDARLAENANDKLLPAFSQMGAAIDRMALEPSKRTGEYLFWQDTASSMKRLGLGVLIAAAIGLALGLFTGSLPLVNAGFSPLLTVVSLIPPLAILPVLFRCGRSRHRLQDWNVGVRTSVRSPSRASASRYPRQPTAGSS